MWNPSPEVAAARDFGKKFKKQMVVVFHFEDGENGLLGYASYGDTKATCGRARKIADKMWSAAYAAFLETMSSSRIGEPTTKPTTEGE